MKLIEKLKRLSPPKVLLFLVLSVLVTTVLSGTVFAKYVANVGAIEERVRVAKWSVNPKFQKFELFKSKYIFRVQGENPYDITIAQSTDGAEGFAPGLAGEVILELDLTEIANYNNSEVAYRANYEFLLNEDLSELAAGAGLPEGTSTVYNHTGYSGNWGAYQKGNALNRATTKESAAIVDDMYWYPLKFKVSRLDETGKAADLLYDGFNLADNGVVQVAELIKAITTKDGTTPRYSDIVYPGGDAETVLKNFRFKIEWLWPETYTKTLSDPVGTIEKFDAGDLKGDVASRYTSVTPKDVVLSPNAPSYKVDGLQDAWDTQIASRVKQLRPIIAGKTETTREAWEKLVMPNFNMTIKGNIVQVD